MKLPEGIFERPRQEALIDKDRWAIIRIDAGSGRYPHNSHYKIRHRSFQEAIEPYLRGDWEEFDRYFRLRRQRILQVDGRPKLVDSIYSTAEHRSDPKFPKLPNITVIPNLSTIESSGMPKPLRVFGTNMGHYHPVESDRVQEVYEFQTYGAMVLDRELGEVELWVGQDGDKVAVPTGCHMTLYNLGDVDFPLITLNFSDPERNPSDKSLIGRYGPFMLGYYDDFEVVFAINRTYINNPTHRAGVRLSSALTESWERKVRISRGARLDLGRLLHEQLTQNPEIIGKFARLGVRVRVATPEVVLEPLTVPPGGRLYFSLPLVTATSKGTDVYRYFFPEAEAAKPIPPVAPVAHPDVENVTGPPNDGAARLDRPLVVLIEGVGDWVEQTYRPLFERKVKKEKRKVAVFYADDTRWKERPQWATEKRSGLRDWEVYLDKADPDDFAKYQKLRPDAVFVVTPDFTHSTIAKRWLNKVPVVFLEKPFDSQITNVENLRRSLKQPNRTDILGIDHYKFYALPINNLKAKILKHLGHAIANVEFYLTEDQPIEKNREKALQYGLTLDLLPHLISLLTYFGDIATIDQICVLAAGQYDPLVARPRGGRKKDDNDIKETFYTETYSRVQFTFLDNSGNDFHVPCFAVVGKGFAREVKYLEIKGINDNSIRVDLRPKPKRPRKDGYPLDSIFFIQGSNQLLFDNARTREVADPYDDNRVLKILEDPNDEAMFRRGLERERYAKLIDDLLDGTNTTITSTLSLMAGQNVVRALDRIWWGIQAARERWTGFELSQGNPFERITMREPAEPAGDHLRRFLIGQKRDGNLSSLERAHVFGPDYDGELQSDRPSTSINTRGRLRSLTSRSNLADVSDLLSGLRREVNDLPLTVLIHGWPRQAASEFLQTLTPSLEPDDAVWLITTDPPDANEFVDEARVNSSFAICGSVNLNLNRKRDRRLYDNLVSDLTFLPGLERKEEKEFPRLRDVSRILVIDSRGPYSQRIIESGRDPRVEMCVWKGEKTLTYFHSGLVTIGSRTPTRDTIDLEEIGQRLKELIKHLEDEYDRRREFRASLLKLMDQFPGRPSWGEDLIDFADSHRWPRWAVECLPQLFVSLEPMEIRKKQALVWHYMVDCIPGSYKKEYSVTNKLCSNQIFRIVMSERVDEFLQIVAECFHRNLDLNPRPSERSLLLAVNKSMMDIEYWIESHEPALAEEFDRKRIEFVDKMKKTPADT